MHTSPTPDLPPAEPAAPASRPSIGEGPAAPAPAPATADPAADAGTHPGTAVDSGTDPGPAADPGTDPDRGPGRGPAADGDAAPQAGTGAGTGAGNRPSRQARRVEARRAKRERVALLAASAVAPSAPVRWGAGWGGRVCGAAVLVAYVASVHRPVGAGLARPEAGAFLFAVWTSLVLAWVVCRLALWRVTADRDGIHVRRMWSTRFLAWPVVGRVELRHDGLLEFFGPRGSTLAGTFAPPWLSRLTRRDCAGRQAADLLTAMSLHPHLRPAGQVSRRSARAGFVRWAVPLAVLVHSAPLLLRT